MGWGSGELEREMGEWRTREGWGSGELERGVGEWRTRERDGGVEN